MKDFFVPKDLLLFSDNMGMNSDFSVRGFSGGQAEAMATLTVTVTAAPSGAMLVWTYSQALANTTNIQIALSDLIVPGDLVMILVGRCDTANGNIGVISPVGYTEVSDLYADDFAAAKLSVSYKIMGESPDTSVTVTGQYSLNRGAGVVIQVWRGVDSTNPMDVAATTATGVNTGIPVPPAITPITEGALVVSAVASANYEAVPFELIPPSGFVNSQTVHHEPGTTFAGGMASMEWSGGEVVPGAWSGPRTNVYSSWAAITMALRLAS